VNELDRKLLGYFALRDGKTSTSRPPDICPKVMIITNRLARRDAVVLIIFAFVRLARWSGLAPGRTRRDAGAPSTIDGGGITAPSLAFYDIAAKWAVETRA